jgi:hypothetical protein
MRKSSVRGIVFSKRTLKFKKRIKKKPPFLAVFQDLLGSRLACYVNRPLLHRLWVGIAKVIKAGKENRAAHEIGPDLMVLLYHISTQLPGSDDVHFVM